MIVDKIENYPLYIGLGDRIRLALEHIRTTDFTHRKAGRYDLDGDNLFVILNDYETVSRKAGQLEGHRQYIDVQYMVRGTEWIGYAPLAGQTMAMDYDEADDCLLYEGEATFLQGSGRDVRRLLPPRSAPAGHWSRTDPSPESRG